MMPELILEFKEDLSEGNQEVRHFFLIPNEKVVFNAREHCFVYYEDRHVNLRGKVAILENHGYVVDVTTGNAPKYRMTEEFVDLLLIS